MAMQGQGGQALTIAGQSPVRAARVVLYADDFAPMLSLVALPVPLCRILRTDGFVGLSAIAPFARNGQVAKSVADDGAGFY